MTRVLVLLAALSLPWPLAAGAQDAGIPLKVFGVAFKDIPSNAGVLVYVEAGPEGFATWTEPGQSRRLDLTVTLHDEAGRIVSERRHAVNTTLGADSVASVRAQGLRLVTQVPAGAGRFVLRASVTDAAAQTAGTAAIQLEIPDFSTPGLHMSGVSVYAWPQRPQLLTVVAQVPMAAVLPWAPTVERVFRRTETIAQLSEIYVPAGTPSDEVVRVRTSLLAPDGRTLAEVAEEWTTAAIRGRRNEYGFQAQLPLAAIPPGRYRLRVAAEVGGAQGEQTVDIRIQ